MAYGIKLDYRPLAEAVAEAEKRAGPGELGYLYRIDDCTYASSDEYGDYSYSSTYIELHAYPITKRTPQGWALDPRRSEYAWVGENWRKQYASPTIQQAFEGLIARRKRQAEIYEARANKARNIHDRALAMLKQMAV